MGVLFFETDINAIDDQGQIHLLSELYMYCDGYFYREEIITINNKKLYIDTNDLAMDKDEHIFVCGDELPYIQGEDLQSYFTANPTSKMQDALRIAELTNVNIVGFFDITVVRDYEDLCEAYGVGITKGSFFEFYHNLGKKTLGEDAEAVKQNLYKKYASMCK